MQRESARRLAAAGLILAALILAAPAVRGADPRPEGGGISFRLAFGSRPAGESGVRAAPVESGAVLKSGDRLKFLIEPRSAMFLYLVHVNPAGELALILPEDPRAAAVGPGRAALAPPGAGWFELDAQTGQERFMLLASAEPLRRLEELLAQHAAMTDRSRRPAVAEAILNEIKQLKLKERPLSQPAEKPVRIGGSVRDPSPPPPEALSDLSALAVEITAPGLFTRTYTVEHR
jgi:hypothetical protein